MNESLAAATVSRMMEGFGSGACYLFSSVPKGLLKVIWGPFVWHLCRTAAPARETPFLSRHGNQLHPAGLHKPTVTGQAQWLVWRSSPFQTTLFMFVPSCFCVMCRTLDGLYVPIAGSETSHACLKSEQLWLLWRRNQHLCACAFQG